MSLTLVLNAEFFASCYISSKMLSAHKLFIFERFGYREKFVWFAVLAI